MCKGVRGDEYEIVAVIDTLGGGPGEVKVDRCIAGHVRLLAFQHVRTYSSCCGHDDPEPEGDWNEPGLFGPALRGAHADADGQWVRRARILIHRDDADAAFDTGYEPEVATYPIADWGTVWPPVLEIQVRPIGDEPQPPTDRIDPVTNRGIPQPLA